MENGQLTQQKHGRLMKSLCLAQRAIALALLVCLPVKSFADDEEKLRNFFDVLEDVVGDFEYDLKNNQVKGLKNLSIRNIVTSENVPPSFKSHLELLITERILKHTKTRIIQCLQCRAKTAQLKDGNIVVTSAESNPAQLARLAQKANIERFLDVAFSFEPSGIILSMHIVDPETGSVVWSKSYNSETSRAAAFRRGVDFSQIDEARRSETYEPTVQYRPTIYYLFERGLTSYKGTLGLGVRVVERYDNRKKEVGFELNYLMNTTKLVGGPADPNDLYSGLNLTLLFVHSWNLIGMFENFHKMRGNIYVAIGGTYASGFLGGLVRTGYEWRFAKHWAVSAVLGYRPKATLFVSGTSAGTVSGMEFGLGVSALF